MQTLQVKPTLFTKAIAVNNKILRSLHDEWRTIKKVGLLSEVSQTKAGPQMVQLTTKSPPPTQPPHSSHATSYSPVAIALWLLPKPRGSRHI